MGRVADYVSRLTPEERERFHDVIDECQSREARIRQNAQAAELALRSWKEQQRQFWHRLALLDHLSRRLVDGVFRLYLLAAPTTGSVN